MLLLLTEKQIRFLRDWTILPLNVKLIGYLQILIGYWHNSYAVTQTSSYVIYETSTILIGYLKTNLVFQKNDWVNTTKHSLSVSLCLLQCCCFFI